MSGPPINCGTTPSLARISPAMPPMRNLRPFRSATDLISLRNQPPIWQPGHDLFHLRTNIAYGCVILRHYLDVENGDYFRALGRYNGSLGRAEYPNMVRAAWQGRWKYDGPTA